MMSHAVRRLASVVKPVTLILGASGLPPSSSPSGPNVMVAAPCR